MSVGFSPAVSLREHLRKYRLPSNCFDFINFTGLHYVGRDLYLVQSSDAIITIGGRFGSLHEFTSALEAHKPCGVLTDSGGTADQIPKLMEVLEPPDGSVVIYDDDPDRLVKRLIAILDEDYKDIHNLLERHDQHWYLRTESDEPKRAG
jgi:predicted Rossmann-fold nucleotide-binding protein